MSEEDSTTGARSGGTPAKQERGARLAEALRANLRRRKAQARARREDVATAPSSGHGTASEDGEDPSSMGPADGPAT
ncbi:MAG: hypothetical protein AAFR79_20070 [Pseudomonadota bacterium]